ncbi:hypothetical protein UFOVP54_64 [uncultured Caudovirales phage]|uniref:Uncharacterized protein n=1 Tax=uncultured Caudovirales phage TaxID=2100421 RepID=A0A6J5KT55_9CAUD|nr:hypothetical protein UFOVP54_64 [uncultured Caudovirales phage]
MISISKILKEILDPTQEYQELVNDIIDQGGEYLGEGDYGVVFLVGDKVVKVTTDSEELEDAQQIKQQRTKYFVYIYDVEVRNAKLGIITMEDLEPFTGSEKDVPIDDIMEEADLLGIYPDLEGPGGSIKMDNLMQDKRGRIKVIDV